MRSLPCAVIFIAIPLTPLVSALQQSQSGCATDGNLSLAGIAWCAAAAGESTVTMYQPDGLPLDLRDVRQASTLYAALVIKPREKLSAPLGFNSIATWYKCDVDEDVSGRGTHSRVVDTVDPGEGPPGSFRALTKNQILLRMPGGQVTIGDVTIKSIDQNTPPLSLNERYFAFLAFDSTGTVGNIELVGSGIYRVSSSGILARQGRRDDLVSKDIRETFHGSLAELRAALNHTPP